MPISERGTSVAKPYTADYTDRAGKRRQNTHALRLDAEIDILENAGPGSAADLATEVSVHALFESLARAAERRNLTELTRSTWRSRANRLVLASIGSKRIADVTKVDFNSLLSGWKAQLSPVSLAGLCTFVTSAFDVAAHRGCTTRNFAKEAFVDVNRTFRFPKRAAHPEDVDLIRRNLEGWRSVQFALYVDAGLTPPETAVLPWVAVDFDRMRIDVAANTEHAGEIASLHRRRLSRWVPMNERLAETMFSWRLDPNCAPTLVIGRPDDTVRARHSILQPLCRLQVDLGIVARPGERKSAWINYKHGAPRYLPRQFRNYAALQWHAQGVGLKEIARRLGYKTSDSLVELVQGQPSPEDLNWMASVDQGIQSIIANRNPASTNQRN